MSKSVLAVRRLVRVAVAAVAVAAVLSTVSEAAAEPRGSHGGTCSDATLRGDYGFTASGTRLLGMTTDRFVAVALWTFDGNGTFTQQAGAAIIGDSGLANGPSSPSPIPGAYEVNPNCSGVFELLIAPFVTVKYSFVIVGKGRQVKGIVTSPETNVVSIELTRK
jgi:hypothetical protein